MSKAEDKIIEIQAICRELGWEIVLDDSAEYITGLIIGRREFLEKIVTGDFDLEDYDLYTVGETEDNGGVH